MKMLKWSIAVAALGMAMAKPVYPYDHRHPTKQTSEDFVNGLDLRGLTDPHIYDRQHKSFKHAIFHSLYSIRLIREHAPEIELEQQQVDRLREAIEETEREAEALKSELEKEATALAELIEQGAPKRSIYRQIDIVFGCENKVKKKYLQFLIVTRDILSDKQRARLDEIKQTEWSGRKHHKSDCRREKK